MRLRIHIAQIPRCLHADRYDPNVPRLLNCRKIPIALIDRGFECNGLFASTMLLVHGIVEGRQRL